jgi:integration host factor subunit alpha
LDFIGKNAFEIVEPLIEIVDSELASGEDVLISDFGKFCVKNKRERRRKNPATGENIVIAQRRVVTFKCSGILRNKVNELQ